MGFRIEERHLSKVSFTAVWRVAMQCEREQGMQTDGRGPEWGVCERQCTLGIGCW